ncbi:MAG TPA: type II toxin-antitoxin system VapC family toxin [Acetobacteraceae bacterium]|nr:type II toxin-antitoxin system VapC family toxin [Acetobacteraceae bacterium]
MLAVDTNVLVRYLTNDHPEQSPRARKLVDGNRIWVSTTVLLETEWVLRSVYRYTPAQIAAALRRFAGLRGVALENAALVARALDWVGQGMDFADALHLGAADHCEAFATFDTDFIRAAKTANAGRVRPP